MNNNVIEKLNKKVEQIEEITQAKRDYINQTVATMKVKFEPFIAAIEKYNELSRKLRDVGLLNQKKLFISLRTLYGQEEYQRIKEVLSRRVDYIEKEKISKRSFSIGIDIGKWGMPIQLYNDGLSWNATFSMWGAPKEKRYDSIVPGVSRFYEYSSVITMVESDTETAYYDLLAMVIYENATQILKEVENYFEILLDKDENKVQNMQKEFENFKEVYEKLLKNAEMRNNLTDVISDLTPEQILKIKIYIEANLQ